MKTLVNYLITESFDNNDLQAILSGICSRLIPDGENLAFNVDLNVTLNNAPDAINISSAEVISRSIGHIVEGVIKSTFPSKLVSADGTEKKLVIKSHSKSTDSYDLDVNGVKFEIKAAKNGKFDSINMSANERKIVDYLLVVDYKYEGGSKVTVTDIYITNISGDNKIKKHMNKKLHSAGVHFKEV